MFSLTTHPTNANLSAIASPGLRGFERNWLANEAVSEPPVWNCLSQEELGSTSGKSYQSVEHPDGGRDLAQVFRIVLQLPSQLMIAATTRGFIMPNLTRSKRLRYRTT
ncbi:MAG: hypothetical protein AAGG51_10155 [Cyanobacteria bacterium P01_G01_bin.54]